MKIIFQTSNQWNIFKHIGNAKTVEDPWMQGGLNWLNINDFLISDSGEYGHLHTKTWSHLCEVADVDFKSLEKLSNMYLYI